MLVEIFVRILEQEGAYLLVNSASNVAATYPAVASGWPERKEDDKNINADATKFFTAPSSNVTHRRS